MSLSDTLCEPCCGQMTAPRDAAPHRELRLRRTLPARNAEGEIWEEREYGCTRCGSLFQHVNRELSFSPAWWLLTGTLPFCAK